MSTLEPPPSLSPSLLPVLGDFPGLPALSRLFTELLLGFLLEPTVLSLDIADKGVLLAVSKEIHPVLQRVISLLLGLAPLLLLQYLKLGLAPVPVHVRVVERQVHVLDSAHVGCAVLGEAASDKATGGIDAGKDVVGSAGAVDTRAGGDVVYGAIDGKVDGLGRVGTIVEGEFLGGYEAGPVLEASSCGQSMDPRAESSRAEGGLYTHNEALPSLHAKVFWRHLHAPEEGLPARDEVAGAAGDEQQEGQDPQDVDPWVPVLDLIGVYPLALLATLLLSPLVT